MSTWLSFPLIGSLDWWFGGLRGLPLTVHKKGPPGSTPPRGKLDDRRKRPNSHSKAPLSTATSAACGAQLGIPTKSVFFHIWHLLNRNLVGEIPPIRIFVWYFLRPCTGIGFWGKLNIAQIWAKGCLGGVVMMLGDMLEHQDNFPR